ncbi:MAG: hypothetical protein FJZ61_04240 [Chlamydiae bacterium]|nr:hypothetical protein [Chlamydiota bacterium]
MKFKSECAVRKCINENTTESGVYSIRPDGSEAMPVQVVAVVDKTASHNEWLIRTIAVLEKIFVAGLIRGIMLVLKASNIPGRIEAILMISLIITVGGFGSTFLWCSFPLGIGAFVLFTSFLSWTIGGLIVARMLKI